MRHSREGNAVMRGIEHIHLQGVAARVKLGERNLDKVARLALGGFPHLSRKGSGIRHLRASSEKGQRHRGWDRGGIRGFRRTSLWRLISPRRIGAVRKDPDWFGIHSSHLAIQICLPGSADCRFHLWTCFCAHCSSHLLSPHWKVPPNSGRVRPTRREANPAVLRKSPFFRFGFP